MESIRLIGAEDVLQASRNIDGSVEQLQRTLTSFSEDMASLMHRFEQAMKQHAGAMNHAAGRLPSGNFGPL